MKTWVWESMQLFSINKELQQLIEEKTVKTVVSMSLTTVENKNGHMTLYSGILIYK
jgi:hypothetical protein